MSETATGEQAAGAHSAPGIVDALRHGQLRRIVLGQLTSNLGDALLPVAVTFALLAQHGGLASVGWMLAARTAAMVVGLLAGGVVADRYPKNHVMIASDVVRAAAVAGVICSLQVHSVTLTVAAMFAFGLGEAFFRPAFRGRFTRRLWTSTCCRRRTP